MVVIGQLFVAGSICEALLLFASITFGWVSGPYRPSAGAFIALLVVGVTAAAATAGLGAIMIRTSRQRVMLTPGGAPATAGPPIVDNRAALALVMGVIAIVLVWPFGIVLAPASFYVGISAVGRIGKDPGRLSGLGRAKAGTLIGAFISGMYLFWILLDVVATYTFGSPIPAAP